MALIKRQKMKRKAFRSYLPLFALTVPGLIYFLINNYLPMFGLTIAFKDVNFAKGIFQSDWVGLTNFKFLFATRDAFVITRNTILYNLAFIILGTMLAIAVAIMLNEIKTKFFNRLYQTVILVPALISMVIVAYIGYAFFSTDVGILDVKILPLLGIDPVSWYAEPAYWPFILVGVYLWINIGVTSMIYYSNLIGINKEYYEAAKIDGASLWQQIRNITLPLMRPVITMMVIIAIGRIFYSDFGLFYQVPMNSGMLYSTTNTIDTYVYRGLMELGDIGMSAAAGFYQSIVGFILVMVSNMIVRKFDSENALF